MEPQALKAVTMESEAESQMTVMAVEQTASLAKPTESAAVQTTTAMNRKGRSASVAEPILAWTMSEIAAAEAIAPLVQQTCRNHGRLCRLPQG